jgi:D-alanine-D-alanine ligase
MKKITVAVIFGSRSTEHDVSIVTAIGSIIKPLEITKKYHVVPIYISKEGKWYSDDRLKNIRFFSEDGLEQRLASLKPVLLNLDGNFSLVKAGIPKKTITIDIAFPATHGTFGEDGYLMGLLEMANVPYVGCGVSASNISMDKVTAKKITESENILSTPWLWFSSSDCKNNMELVLNKINTSNLTYPLFVKPAHLGSSIGIAMVSEKNELQNAIEVAMYYDEKIIIEQAVSNLVEVTLPIIGNETPIVSFLESPLTQDNQFFDFETKYLAGDGKKGGKKGNTGAQGYSQIPAELPKDLYEKAEAIGVEVYKALECSGLARVDMLIDTKTDKVYFNEVNPLPGSLYAHNWAKKGVSNVMLVEKLLEYGFERYEQKAKFQTIFQSSFLQNK